MTNRSTRPGDDGYEIDLAQGERSAPPAQGRRVVVSVPFQREQYEIVSARAKDAGMPLATYVRHAALHFSITSDDNAIVSYLTYDFDEGGSGSFGYQGAGSSTTFGDARPIGADAKSA